MGIRRFGRWTFLGFLFAASGRGVFGAAIAFAVATMATVFALVRVVTGTV